MIIQYNNVMDSRDSDIFELTNKNLKGIEYKESFIEDDNPFFNMQLSYQEPARRLNDYDNNILEDGAYKNLNDDLFKLEYKISKTEENIKILQAEINTAIELNDFNKVQDLQRKLSLEMNEYKNLRTLYNSKTLSAKITDSFSGIFDKTIGTKLINVNKNIFKVYQYFIAKLPKKLIAVLKLKKSLGILENINKNVDDLVTMTVPYGENIDKYRQLSKYIAKANSIHSEISNCLKNK